MACLFPNSWRAISSFLHGFLKQSSYAGAWAQFKWDFTVNYWPPWDCWVYWHSSKRSQTWNPISSRSWKPSNHRNWKLCWTWNFVVCQGNKDLEDHLKNCSSRETYTSWINHNNLMNYCQDFMTEAIIKKVKLENFFIIMWWSSWFI